jgi:helix-turn-helix protein
MSVEAISWALNLAPVPADRRGQPSSTYKFVLVALANHAGPDGSGAFPSVATLVRYTGLSERTVRTCLDRLEAGGIIRPCDPDLVAARIKRADRRPQGWDLDLTLARDDLNEPGVTVPESQSPVRRAGLAPIERPHHERPPNGVQPTRPRGAAVAPEPSREPSLKPSAAPGPTRTRAAAVGGRGGRPADEFFAALPDAWKLTGEQQARLSPAVETALSSGWTPAALAAFTGANTEGVRSPFAVLTARLSPAELPPPPGRRPARPPWCVSAARPPGCSASTATRRARARAASRPPQPAAPVPPRRWPAPVPVHLRHRCTAVTDCERHQSCMQTGFTPNADSARRPDVTGYG